MAGSLIDTLLQTVTAPRATEPARNSENRGGGEFRPVLDEALTAGPKPAGQLEPHTDDDAAAEESAAATSGAFEAESTDDAAQQSDCEACSATENSDHETADSAEETGVGPASEEIVEEESAEEADDVEVSLAAAEAAAALEASQPKLETTTAPVEERDAIGDVLAAAKGENGQDAGDDAAAKRAAETGRSAVPTAELEIGDAEAVQATALSEAPPELATLENTVGEAKRKSSAPAIKASANAEEPSEASSQAPKTKAVTEKQAQIAGPQAAAGASETATTDVQATHAANGEAAKADGEAAADTAASAARDRQVEPNSQPIAAQQRDVPEAALPSGAAAVPAAPPTGDANAAATPIAAVTAPTVNTNESGAASRSSTAIARLAAERSLHAGGGQGDEVDAARFVSRVEGALRAAHQRDGRVQVRLSPPELGALRIELTIQNGVMTARLEAETPAARNLLLDNLPALRDRLAQQDVRIDQFDVDVRRDGGGSAGGNAGQNGPGDRPAQEPAWRQNQQRQDRGEPAAAKRAPTRPDAAATDAALDVRV